MLKKNHASIKLNGKVYSGGTPVTQKNTGAVYVDGIKPTPRPLTVKRTINHLKAQQPAPTHTLMRHAVSKPSKSLKRIDSVSLPIRSPLIAVPPMAGRLDPNLVKKAKTYRLSHAISHFGAPLRSAPVQSVSYDIARDLAQTNSRNEQVLTQAQQTAPTILERAVQNATSHEQPKLSKKAIKKPKSRARRTAIGIVSLMAVLVLAYGIYANMPNVMVKVASVRAGFSAVMPAYRPSGYSLSSVNYQPGTIKFNFTSNIDNRQFSLIEHSSNWDSATLVSSMIVPVEGSNFVAQTVNGQKLSWRLGWIKGAMIT